MTVSPPKPVVARFKRKPLSEKNYSPALAFVRVTKAEPDRTPPGHGYWAALPEPPYRMGGPASGVLDGWTA